MLFMSVADDAGSANQYPAAADLRLDPYVDTAVYVVGSRQSRPNLPSPDIKQGCPFCPGGLEAPDPYRTRFFVNRWPAFPDDRCEVVLYSPDHDASLASLGLDGVLDVITMWTQRTHVLGARDDVAYVLVFENRGADVGATIAHPHGQIYAYDHVPSRPAHMFGRAWEPTPSPERHITDNASWMAYVPHAAAYPVAINIAPKTRHGALTDLDAPTQSDLAAILIDVGQRLDRLYGQPLPYMMWINQRPTDGSHTQAWMNIDLVSPWRAAGLARYIAAAEIGGGEFFNPVVPEELASRLRSA